MTLLEFKKVSKIYTDGGKTTALKNLELSIDAGEFVALMGPSGSGKSTLLHLIGLLDRPTSGHYRLEGDDTASLSDTAVARLRNQRIGFVFQSFNLLGRLTLLRNVELPMIYAGTAVRERRIRAKQLLTDVGLADKTGFKPANISGGQMQRAAIARALANHPDIVLADEPTGNLDTKTGRGIMDILAKLNDAGVTIIVVTHDPEIAKYAKRVITMRDGEIAEDKK